ncbi:MAG: hypothetical protein EZS28_053140, partial [Streblomastix strix]
GGEGIEEAQTDSEGAFEGDIHVLDNQQDYF